MSIVDLMENFSQWKKHVGDLHV